jgi:hypothetical protein
MTKTSRTTSGSRGRRGASAAREVYDVWGAGDTIIATLAGSISLIERRSCQSRGPHRRRQGRHHGAPYTSELPEALAEGRHKSPPLPRASKSNAGVVAG